MKFNKTSMIFGLAGLLVMAAVAAGVSQKSDEGRVVPTPLPPVEPTFTSVSPTAQGIVDGTLKLSARLGQSHVLQDQGLAPGYLLVNVDATSHVDNFQAPLDLAVVIDSSGSMRGQPIEDARRAAHALFARLRPGDRATLISYASSVTVEVPLMEVSANVARFQGAVDELLPNGGTNISGGLTTAQQVLTGGEAKTPRVRRIILLSDGHATAGMTEVRQLAGLAAKGRQGGVTTTAMGLGLNFNERAMTQIALQGGGNYHFIERSTSLSDTFAREFQNLKASVARDALVRVKPAPGTRIRTVHGFAHRLVQGEAVVPLSEFFAGQNKSLLIELDIPGSRQSLVNVASVTLDYLDLTRSVEERGQLNLSMATTDDAERVTAGVDARVLVRREQILTAQAYDDAMGRYESGDRDGARRVIQQRRVAIEASNKALRSDKLVKEAKAADALLDSMERHKPSSAGGKAAIKTNRARSYKLQLVE